MLEGSRYQVPLIWPDGASFQVKEYNPSILNLYDIAGPGIAMNHANRQFRCYDTPLLFKLGQAASFRIAPSHRSHPYAASIP
jgi:hypothetical protein